MKNNLLLCAYFLFGFVCLAPFQQDGFAQAPAIQWQKSYGGSLDDVAYDVAQSADGSFLMFTGLSQSSDGDLTLNHGDYDYWVVKLDPDGNIIWQKSFGGTSRDFPYSLNITPDGGSVIAGYSKSHNGDVTVNKGLMDFWIIKLDGNGNLQWQKSYGGSGEDVAWNAVPTSDGGYIVDGRTNSTDGDVTVSHGGDDIWILKLDANGNLQWQKSIGGSDEDHAHGILQTANGSYVFSGHSASFDGDIVGNHGEQDVLLVKLNANGKIVWQKCYGGSEEELAYAVHTASDGGFVLTGYTESTDGDVSGTLGKYDYWVIKTDAGGNLQWQKPLGGSTSDYSYAVTQTNDGGYAVTGYANSDDGEVTNYHGGQNDHWIAKLDATGNLQWQKALGSSLNDRGGAIIQTADGSIIEAGDAGAADGDVTSIHGGQDVWIVKLNPSSAAAITTLSLNASTYCPGDNVSISFTANTSFQPGNIFTAQLSDASGNFTNATTIGTLAGISSGTINAMLPKTASGNGYRIRVIASSPNTIGSDNGSDITITCSAPTGLASNNITTSSATLSWNVVNCADAYGFRYRKQGASQWITSTPGSNSTTLTGLDASTTYQWAVRTKCTSNPNTYSKYSATQKFTTLHTKTQSALSGADATELILYPNPAQQFTTVSFHVSEEVPVSISLFDITGKKIRELLNVNSQEGDYQVNVDLKTLPKGIYLVRFQSGENIICRKLVVE